MKTIRLSLRNKLFLFTFLILFVNVAVVLVLSETMLNRFLLYNAKNELDNYHNKINQSYEQNDINGLNQTLDECSQNNITILIYDIARDQIVFSTARSKDGAPKGGIDPNAWIKLAYGDNIFERLKGVDPIIIEGGAEDSIFLYSKTKDNTYLFMETPRAYIKNTSAAAVEFFIVLSFVTFTLGALALYVIVKRMTHPIEEIDKVTQEIAKLNFQNKLNINTHDELEVLANNINAMADKLKDNIDLLKKDLEREEKTNKLRREFISNVSHDLKTPLTLISSYTQAMQDERVDKKEAVSLINEQVKSMSDLVSKTLTLSRLESKTTTYNMAPFEISEMVYNAIDSFKITIDEKKIVLKKDIDIGCIVNGDYNYLRQAFVNYMDNAVKYVDNRKEIGVSCKNEGDYVKIEVKNTSAYISDKQINDLFEMYYKIDKSRGKNINSYGIGLSIVRNIVKAHNGIVGADYKEGKISFYFKLKKFNGLV